MIHEGRTEYKTAIITTMFRLCLALIAPVACLAASAEWPEADGLVERNVLHRIDRDITIDGNLSEWTGLPGVVDGCNTLLETRLCSSTTRGWCAKGILLGVEAMTPGRPAGRSTDDSVDVFLDLRPPGARMERYEPGVYHITLHPFAENKSIALLEPYPTAPGPARPAPLPGVVAQAIVTSRGWTMEALIPWSSIGGFEPAVAKWIALTLRTNHKDPAANRTYSVGVEDIGSKNPPETAPIAFSPVRLIGASDMPEPFSYTAQEVVRSGKTWLDIEVIAPDSRALTESAQLKIEAPQLGWTSHQPLARSSAGYFRVATEHLPLSLAAVPALTINLAIPDAGWARAKVVPLRVTDLLLGIERELPEGKIGSLPKREAAVVRMLKACAQEAAAMVATAPDGARPPQARLRSILTPGIYDSRRNLFVDAAKRFLNGAPLDPSFPFAAWQSDIDGQWIPVRIIYPWQFDPEKKYPARLFIFGSNQHRSRADFVEPDLRSAATGQLYPYFGDWFSIVLFNRTNDTDDLEREAYEHLWQRLIPSLPIDPHKVSVYGGSSGAATALQLALHFPDRFASVGLRAGNFRPVVPASAKEALEALEPLSPISFYVVAGAANGEVTSSNRYFARLLKYGHYKHIYEELPDTGHYFSPPATPAGIADSSAPFSPSHVAVVTTTPDYGAAYWLSLDAVENWGATAKLKGAIERGTLSISAQNVSRFAVDLSRLSTTPEIEAIVINDAATFKRLRQNPRTIGFEKARTAERWTLIESGAAANDGTLHKRRGLAGPAWRLETRRVTVIYGTINPALTPVLRERAFRVVAERVGGGAKQSCVGDIRIVADAEFRPEGENQSNLWLIGGTAENEITRRMADRLPLVGALGTSYIQTYASSAPDALLGYVYPSGLVPNSYVYVEQGNSARAYLMDVLPSPTHDISLQWQNEGGDLQLRADDFDAMWKIQRRP